MSRIDDAYFDAYFCAVSSDQALLAPARELRRMSLAPPVDAEKLGSQWQDSAVQIRTGRMFNRSPIPPVDGAETACWMLAATGLKRSLKRRRIFLRNVWELGRRVWDCDAKHFADGEPGELGIFGFALLSQLCPVSRNTKQLCRRLQGSRVAVPW